jgi:tetratricopeptide (TPR) repeat protein
MSERRLIQSARSAPAEVNTSRTTIRRSGRAAPFIAACFACFSLCGCAVGPGKIDYSKYTSKELNDFGVVYEQAGNLREAERVYKQALVKDPANCIAASNLANVYCKNGKLDEAAGTYRKALTICPDYVPALNNLANVQIEIRKYAGAEQNLQKALKLAETRPEKRAVYLSLALLKERTGEKQEAEKWTQKAAAIRPVTIIADVPFFKQKQYDCGPAALACVYNFFGVKQNPDEIAKRVYSRKQKGSLNLKLLIDAREQGLTATMYSGSFEQIKQAVDNQTPLILMLSAPAGSAKSFAGSDGNEGLLHYVVVVGYEGNDVSAVVAHDGYKPHKRYTRDVLEKQWAPTGYCTIEIRK